MTCSITEWIVRMRQGLRSRYVRLLEEEVARERAEVARLRAENRALLNSLLGTAGVPPIETSPPHLQSVSPVRRRSWPQISAAREIEAARQARTRERERAESGQ